MAVRQKAEAAKLSHRPAGALVIRGARLFDPETGAVRPGTTVVISGNRIQAVGRDGEVPVPAGAEIVEARGKTLLPGLWDMHQHFTDADGLLDLAAGVTTGRDLGNDPDYLLDLKQRWDTGEALGPRVVLAGVIDGPGPYASPDQGAGGHRGEGARRGGPLRRRSASCRSRSTARSIRSWCRRSSPRPTGAACASPATSPTA